MSLRLSSDTIISMVIAVLRSWSNTYAAQVLSYFP
jgi:hypothetical protein